MLKKYALYTLIGVLSLLSVVAIGVPLETFQDFVTANPLTSRRGPWAQLMARGSGTNDMYVIEVDPTTGAIPVSANINNPSVGSLFSPIPGSATLIGALDDNGDLVPFRVNSSGELQVTLPPASSVTNFGAPNSAQRVAAVIGNATGAAAFGSGTVSAQTQRVTIATDDVVGVQATDLDIRDLSSATDSVSAVQSGTWATRVQDGSGNAITSTTGALDVNIDNASIAVTSTDLDIRDLSSATDSVSAAQTGTWSTRTQDGSGNAISSTSGALDVNIDNASIAVTSTNLDIRDLSSATDSVSVGGSLPAGTNNIGDVDVVSLPSIPAGTNNIGDVDVASLPSIPAGANTIGSVGVTNLPATVSTNSGASDASTIRVVQATNSPSSAGRSYSDSARLDYSSTNVTTGAWVQIDASTLAAINAFYLFSSCGEALELGAGAAASETRIALIPPGGLDGAVPLAIPSGTRLSVRGVSGSCTSGQLLFTGLQ